MSAGVECRLQLAVQRLSLVGDPSCRVGLLQRVVNLAQELLRRAALRMKRDGGYRAEGFVSPGAWLACHSGLSGPAARAVVREAVELQHMAASTAAAERGVLSEQQVRLLTECRRADPEQYDAGIDAAFVALPVAELVLAARAWKAAAEDRRHDPNRPAGTPPEHASVHLSQLLDGRWRLDGVLNAHDGAVLNQALDQSIARQLQAQRDGDPFLERLSVGAMRAQGLVEFAAQALRDTPGQRSRSGRYRHCTHWQDHGETSVHNGVLLCRRHHVFIHTHHWTIHLDHQQQPVFRQPDGTVHPPGERLGGADQPP